MPSDIWTENTKHLQVFSKLKVEDIQNLYYSSMLCERQTYILQQLKQKAEDHIFVQYCI